MLSGKLKDKLRKREQEGLLRTLPKLADGVDFVSNDYLGLARLEAPISERSSQMGSTGSRLLSGNLHEYTTLESEIAGFHKSEAALVFPSGYMANLAVMSCFAQRGDTILYDQYMHASIRDGIRLSNANAHSFRHNDVQDLETKLKKAEGDVYVVTESVFSMSGQQAPLTAITELCGINKARLIVDEAHALGVIGPNGEGLCQKLQIENQVFARVFTYGKALGVHGAAVVSSAEVIEYLINFARPFIYTTALPPLTLNHIAANYNRLKTTNLVSQLGAVILYFKNKLTELKLTEYFIESDTAIQSLPLEGVENLTRVTDSLIQKGFNVLPIRYPTVQKGEELIRISLHLFNTETEINDFLLELKNCIDEN